MSDVPRVRALVERVRPYGSSEWWTTRLRDAWSRPELRWLAAILLLATVLRVVWVLYAARSPQGLHDPLLYLLSAVEIANGNGYRFTADTGPTAYYPIGYPAALSAVFSLLIYTPIPDNFVKAGAFFNVVLGVATVALAYVVAQRLFSSTVGLLTALWIAVFPNLIFHTATFLTETLFNFLVMAAFAVLVSKNWKERRLGPGRLLFFGALLGASALVRPISLLFLPLLLLVWLLAGLGWRRALGYAAAITVTTVAVIIPWSIRNVVTMNAPVVISTNLGDNLCMGHYPGATGHFALPATCFEDPAYEGLERPEFEVKRNNVNVSKAVRFALKNPRAELQLLSDKARFLWEDDHDGLLAVQSYGDDPFIELRLRGWLSRVSDVFFFTTISIGGLGLAGFVLAPRDPRRVFFLSALLAFAGIPLVFFGDSRFHVPVMPLLAVSAAWMVTALPALARRLAQLTTAAAPGETADVMPDGKRPVAGDDTAGDG